MLGYFSHLVQYLKFIISLGNYIATWFKNENKYIICTSPVEENQMFSYINRIYVYIKYDLKFSDLKILPQNNEICFRFKPISTAGCKRERGAIFWCVLHVYTNSYYIVQLSSCTAMLLHMYIC